VVIRIGTCGWSYDHWQPELYAPGLPAARPAGPLRGRLPHRRAQQQLLPLAPAIGVPPLAAEIAPRWLPPVRQGTTGPAHRRKLDAPEIWMRHIGAGGYERGGRRAVLLAQLAPSHARDDARLGYSLQLAPAGYGSRPNSAPSWHCEEVSRIFHGPPRRFLKGRGAWPGDLLGAGDRCPAHCRSAGRQPAQCRHDRSRTDGCRARGGLRGI
jgi:hypothetical protein